MNQVVATLPITPRRNAAIGFYSIPLFADVIGSLTNTPTLHAISILGTKGISPQEIDTHLSSLERLGISTKLQWRDADESWEEIISEALLTGYCQGWVIQDERIIMTCSCGKTEFQANNSTLSEIHGERKVYEVRDGEAHCLICRTRATPQKVQCLLVRIPEKMPVTTVIPGYAAREWRQLSLDISGRELLVSRIRETGITIGFNGQKFNIDIDFAWKLFLKRLNDRGLKCSCLVVGHKTLKHALTICSFNALLGTPIPEFIVSTPYMSFDFSEQQVNLADSLIDCYGNVPLRWFLGMGFGCKQKNITLRSSLIYLISHSIDIGINGGDTTKPFTADILWKEFNAERIQKILACFRRETIGDLTPIELDFARSLGLTQQRIK